MAIGILHEREFFDKLRILDLEIKTLPFGTGHSYCRMYRNDKPRAEQVCWESLPKVFVEKHNFLLPQYIKSKFALLHCYLNICMFADYSSHITVHKLLFSNRKNEAPNHDTGCGSGNNHRAGSRHSLQSVRTGQSPTAVRTGLFCQRL
jgi:hypothetical protein